MKPRLYSLKCSIRGCPFRFRRMFRYEGRDYRLCLKHYEMAWTAKAEFFMEPDRMPQDEPSPRP